MGNRIVQVTWDANRKKEHAIHNETAGAQRRSTRAVLRTRRPAHAMSEPPTTMSSSAIRNHSAVGSPAAPSSLT